MFYADGLRRSESEKLLPICSVEINSGDQHELGSKKIVSISIISCRMEGIDQPLRNSSVEDEK